MEETETREMRTGWAENDSLAPNQPVRSARTFGAGHWADTRAGAGDGHRFWWRAFSSPGGTPFAFGEEATEITAQDAADRAFRDHVAELAKQVRDPDASELSRPLMPGPRVRSVKVNGVIDYSDVNEAIDLALDNDSACFATVTEDRGDQWGCARVRGHAGGHVAVRHVGDGWIRTVQDGLVRDVKIDEYVQKEENHK